MIKPAFNKKQDLQRSALCRSCGYIIVFAECDSLMCRYEIRDEMKSIRNVTRALKNLMLASTKFLSNLIKLSSSYAGCSGSDGSSTVGITTLSLSVISVSPFASSNQCW